MYSFAARCYEQQFEMSVNVQIYDTVILSEVAPAVCQCDYNNYWKREVVNQT